MRNPYWNVPAGRRGAAELARARSAGNERKQRSD
jgi:hypothetical protein